jgi:hypothetical protein
VFPGRIRAVYSTSKQDIDLCDGYLYRNKFNFVLLVEGQCAHYTEPRRISDKYHGCTLVFGSVSISCLTSVTHVINPAIVII